MKTQTERYTLHQVRSALLRRSRSTQNFANRSVLFYDDLCIPSFRYAPPARLELREFHQQIHEGLQTGWGIRVTPSKILKNMMNLPRQVPQKPLLVLDMDETLIYHNNMGQYSVTTLVKGKEIEIRFDIRPFFSNFLRTVSAHYEIVVFTASLQYYADPILNFIDGHNVLKKRLYRSSWIYEKQRYIKDLRIFRNVPLSQILIVDNSIDCMIANLDNGIPILTWKGNPDDEELLKLAEYLRQIASATDLREQNSRCFDFRKFFFEKKKYYDNM